MCKCVLNNYTVSLKLYTRGRVTGPRVRLQVSPGSVEQEGLNAAALSPWPSPSAGTGIQLHHVELAAPAMKIQVPRSRF